MTHKLIYVLSQSNGTGGTSFSSGEFTVNSQNDLDRCIALLERTKEHHRCTLDLDLLGPFNKDIKLSFKYARVMN